MDLNLTTPKIETRLAMFNLALDYYGLVEIPGVENNQQILNFFHDIGHTWVPDDELSWCSAFINWLAWKLNIEKSGALDARSWLKVGKEIKDPQRGHLAVYWRSHPDSWKGHVGLVTRVDLDTIWTLGGNQNNMVKISPYSRSRLLSYIELPYLT